MIYGKMTEIICYPNGSKIFVSGIEPFLENCVDFYDKPIHTIISLLNENRPSEVLDCIPYFTKKYYYSVFDSLDENISRLFFTTFLNIYNTVSNGNNILIHCRAGISRSITILIAFFLKVYKYDPEYFPPINSNDVYSILIFIRRKRPIANPNPNFMNQLQRYSVDLLN